MKIKLSKSQWESIGKKAGWMRTQYESPRSSHIDQAIRDVSTFRANGSITQEQFFQQMKGISKAIQDLPNGDDKNKLITLFNGNYFDKIEESK